MSSNQRIVPLPKSIEVIAEYDAIVIRRKWKSPVAYFLAIFSLFWNGFMIVWMSIALASGEWTMAAFGTLHAAVGLGLLYFTLALFRNQTDIRVNALNLSVKHHPMPWPGNVTLDVTTVAQLYCKKVVHRGKNGVTTTYELHAIDRQNRQTKLLSGLPEYEQAHYIETEIEKIIGIKNTPVAGETHS